MVIDLQADGLVDFIQCSTEGGLRSEAVPLGGGAVSATKEVNITSGHVRFSDCFSETELGHAVLSRYGTINIGEAAHVIACLQELQGFRLMGQCFRAMCLLQMVCLQLSDLLLIRTNGTAHPAQDSFSAQTAVPHAASAKYAAPAVSRSILLLLHLKVGVSLRPA